MLLFLLLLSARALDLAQEVAYLNGPFTQAITGNDSISSFVCRTYPVGNKYIICNNATGTGLHVDQLTWQFTQLSGTIPSSWTLLTVLTFFGMTFASLTGTVPPLPANLQHLVVGYNSLVALPPTLPSSLQQLMVMKNRITGSVPVIPTSVSNLWLMDNRFFGSISLDDASYSAPTAACFLVDWTSPTEQNCFHQQQCPSNTSLPPLCAPIAPYDPCSQPCTPYSWAPTPAPTAAPTKYPTPQPTAAPSKYPTPQPSTSPTKYPSPNPTASPTKYPTPQPTPPTPAPPGMPVAPSSPPPSPSAASPSSPPVPALPPITDTPSTTTTTTTSVGGGDTINADAGAGGTLIIVVGVAVCICMLVVAALLLLCMLRRRRRQLRASPSGGGGGGGASSSRRRSSARHSGVAPTHSRRQSATNYQVLPSPVAASGARYTAPMAEYSGGGGGGGGGGSGKVAATQYGAPPSRPVNSSGGGRSSGGSSGFGGSTYDSVPEHLRRTPPSSLDSDAAQAAFDFAMARAGAGGTHYMRVGAPPPSSQRGSTMLYVPARPQPGEGVYGTLHMAHQNTYESFNINRS